MKEQPKPKELTGDELGMVMLLAMKTFEEIHREPCLEPKKSKFEEL